MDARKVMRVRECAVKRAHRRMHFDLKNRVSCLRPVHAAGKWGMLLPLLMMCSCASADYFALKQQIQKKPDVIVVYQPLRGMEDETALRLAQKDEFSQVAVDVAEIIRKEEKLNVSTAYCKQRMGEHCKYSAIAIENPELELALRPPDDGSILLFYVYPRGDYRRKVLEGFPPECTLVMSVDLSPSDIHGNKIGGVYSRNNFYSETRKGGECLQDIPDLMKVISPRSLLPEVRQKLQNETRRILEETRRAQGKQ